MPTRLTILLAFTIICTDAFTQGMVEVEIRISGVTKAKGQMMIAAYDQEDKFLSKDLFNGIVKPVKSAGKMIIKTQLPSGKRLAFSVFHDLNSNEELDTNFFGIPTEPYGFGNNAKGYFLIHHF